MATPTETVPRIPLKIATDEPFVARVYLFNRLWRFGAAELALGSEHPDALVYSAP